MSKVNRRGGFSDRMSIKANNTKIQITDFDERTRVKMFNCFNDLYTCFFGKSYYGNSSIQDFFFFFYDEIFCELIDIRHYISDDKCFKDIQKVILNDSYDDVLTLLEGIAEYFYNLIPSYMVQYPHQLEQNGLLNPYEVFNRLFQEEYVGYRFINQQVSPISDDNEVKTIENALSISAQFKSARDHIEKAHGLLADRDNPDYENSIKESITAIEALCEIVTGERGANASLGKLLKHLENKGIVIHSALRSAFNSLYGYTSDANGIRHAGDIGGPASTFEEAKFMVVSCSAFINYLIAQL